MADIGQDENFGEAKKKALGIGAKDVRYMILGILYRYLHIYLSPFYL